MKVDTRVTTDRFRIFAESKPWPKYIRFDCDINNPPEKVKMVITYLKLTDNNFRKCAGQINEFIVSDESYTYIKKELNEYLIFVWADSGR